MGDNETGGVPVHAPPNAPSALSVAGPIPQVTPTVEKKQSEDPPIIQIYDKLNQLFGQGVCSSGLQTLANPCPKHDLFRPGWSDLHDGVSWAAR